MIRKNRTNKSTLRRAAARGFTLLEMVIVVTIIAMLAGMIGWKIFGALGSSKHKIAKTVAAAMANALNQYCLDTGVQPEDGMDLLVLILGPDEGGGPFGPYLTKKSEKAIEDPWGNYFFVRVPGEVNDRFDIVSYGADGQPGGIGEDADLTN